jgi:glutathione S-transferase
VTDLILHHYDFSNFAEKARLMLGFKRLAWHSVEQPPILPKPRLLPLTGGYRRIPILQDGADLWCDTRLIAHELERRVPSPTLFPDGTRGFGEAIAWWAEHQFMRPSRCSCRASMPTTCRRACTRTARSCTACPNRRSRR